MDSATDTDSDADSSCAEPLSMRARWSPSFGSSPTDKQSSLQEINAALQNLRTLNMRLLVKDVTYANTIGRASIIIVCAIRELATPESWDCDELMDVFKEITSEWFLSKLLAYRREFLPIRVLSASIDGTLVSCVDVILANISMASVCIASRTTDMDGLEGTLAKQREDEAIRAASQLPHTWAEMLDLLTSNTASFAVLRLSLRLTFAAYTLHPHLSGVKTQTATFAPSWPNKVVRTYLSRISSTESGVHEYHIDETPSVRSLRDRIAFAMILGLCSVAKQTSYSVGETPLEFPYVFPPEVLYLIRAVIDPDPSVTVGSASSPSAFPDGAQIVLLCWGQVVPWSWSIWNDARFAGVELITQLTAAWICHVDTLCSRMRCMRQDNWQKLLLRASKSSASDAAVVVTQVMDHISQCSSLQKVEGTFSMCSDLSLRTCWLAAQLLNPCHSWHVAATPNLIKSMCCTFIKCMTEGGNLEAREALIEGLTHVAVDELRAAIQTLQDDKQSRFFSMFDNMIEFLQKTISSASRMHAPLTSTMIRTTRLMMNFLTLCCNASRLCCGASVSALLTTVAAYASKLDDTLCLSCHLLTSFSSLEGSRADILLNKSISVKLHKVPWEIALSCPRSDILVASCLASCVLALEHLESPHPSIAVEIWDYMRDVLLLILTEHYIEDEAPLGFLVAPTLCSALLALLSQMGDLLVTWALCSPWAKDFCMELRALLRGNENGLSKTRVILKRRLSLAGRRLIKILENGKEGEPAEGWPKEGMESVYYKGNIVRVVTREKRERMTSDALQAC